jgi:hypothetical protein
MLRPCDGAGDLARLLEDKRKNAFLIGPGGGGGQAMRETVLAALSSDAAGVLDADALTAFEDRADDLFGAIRGALRRDPGSEGQRHGHRPAERRGRDQRQCTGLAGDRRGRGCAQWFHRRLVGAGNAGL